MASVVGAVIWGGITYVSGYKLGLVAIGVGFLVGYAVKYFGNGSSIAFGIIGALFSVFGCLLGNILAVVASASMSEGVPLLTIVLAFMSDPLLVFRILQETFSGMDILFYGIAIYEGFRFSIAEAPQPQPEVLGLQDQAPPPPPSPAPVAETENADQNKGPQ